MIHLKVVINKCFGGFGLSVKAIQRLAELKGWQVGHFGTKLDSYSAYFIGVEKGSMCTCREIDRCDEDLVKVVEELGAEANGPSAKLSVEDIFLNYEIVDHDGYESVET